MKKVLLSILLPLTLTVGVSAQEDTVEVAKRPIIPSIYIDYGKLLTLPTKTEEKYEVGLEVLISEKIPIVFEVGKATLNPEKAYANGEYEAKGTYFRIGTGVYSQFTAKNKLGLVFKYGLSSFDEIATITESNRNLNRTLSESYDRNDLSASWLELNIYSDRQFNKFLALGINIRYRYLLDYDIQAPDDVYVIPGYGRSFDNSIPAANLFLKISF